MARQVVGRYNNNMESVNEILSAAQALSASDRVKLIALLWDDLAPHEWAAPSDEWIAEANRRSDAIDDGRLTSDTWENTRERARRKAGLDG